MFRCTAFGAFAVVLIFNILHSPSVLAEPPSFNGNRKPVTLVTPVKPAPITPFLTAEGGVTNLTRFKGSVVLLNIWATWCAACLHELPALDRLQAAYPDARLKVLTVSVDEGGHQSIKPYFARLGIRRLPALTDPTGRSLDAFGVYDGLPWSIIIDPEGRFRGYLMGAADWDSPEAHAFLNYFVSEK